MYFHFLNFNRYKITKIAFSVFLVVSILNLTFVSAISTFAEDEAPPAEIVEETLPSDTAPETVVETGDAISQTEIGNDINTSDTDTETNNNENNEEQNNEGSIDLTIQNESEAEAHNISTTTANTGNNEADGGDGSAIVDSGDAVANTDVVNQVNTNIVDSDGEIIAGGSSLGGASLDLRDITASTTSSCDGCISSTTITNQNTATVTNNILVSANTGDNSASSTATSTILTGDAYAGANVVNIVNTNIVHSNYMLLVFNNFGDWSGDLVFPNVDFFANFLSFFNPNCDCEGDTNISNSNLADISNGVNTSANSGNNNAGGGSSVISTGNALSSSNTYNAVNTNVYGDSSFYLLVKVFGDWNGNIFNLPDGIVWENTPEGLVLYSDGDGSFENGEKNAGNLNIENENIANVENNVDVSANTGGNTATGTDAFVATGNAYAGTNVVNVVNTNIISSNWMATLVNVFGNWNGNISFGQPDLWIGTVADVDGEVLAGSSVTFTTTVKNNGDAKASDINILANLKSSYFKFNQSYSDSNLHHIDSLMPGESVQFSYFGMVERFVPDERPPVIIDTTVSSFETDGNIKDNFDTLSFDIADNVWATIITNTSFSFSYPDLEVTKTHTIPSIIGINGEEMVPFEGSVDYKIVVKNHGGSAFKGVLYDKLEDENGNIVNTQSWELGEILPDEEIVVTYTTEFTNESVSGTYTNYAWVEAVGGDIVNHIEENADSNVASDKITLAKKQIVLKIPEPEPEKSTPTEVLGLFTEISPIVEEEQYIEFFGGFCTEEKNDKKINMSSLSQGLLLGLSLILIIRKREGLHINLFLI